MIETRVIPCLLIKGNGLVKTVNFNKFAYIGDPLNTCRIFNELEVDEMMILDIEASKQERHPNFKILESLTNECFMPISYGGGISDIEDAKELFRMGFEKIVLNSILFTNKQLLSEITSIYGSQSVIASVDVRRNMFGKYYIYSKDGSKKEKVQLLDWCKVIEELGAGEILLTNIDKEGTWKGFDLKLIHDVSSIVRIPVVANGGAGCRKDVENAVNIAGASAVALGSMVVFQKKGMGVLINYNHDFLFNKK